MYKIAVCDDEEAVLAQVKELITEWNPSVDVVCFSSGEALLENYQSYEAVFLDIDMAGMNGIETGKAIRKLDKDTKIVYLTGYKNCISDCIQRLCFRGFWRSRFSVFIKAGK